MDKLKENIQRILEIYVDSKRNLRNGQTTRRAKYSKIRESNKILADGVFTNIKENTKGAT